MNVSSTSATIKSTLLVAAVAFALVGLAAASTEPPTMRVAFLGDVMLSGWVPDLVERQGTAYPFSGQSGLLAEVDHVVVNLEAPISDRGQRYVEKTYAFKAPVIMAQVLAEGRATVATLANNHAMDFGWEALDRTRELLAEKGIRTVGAGADEEQARAPLIIEHDGIRLALLARSKTFPFEFFASENSPGTAPGDIRDLVADVRRAREKADFVVLMVHWGGELLVEPRDYQREYAKTAIEAGASLVIGHHPHVVQGIERVHQAWVLHSLGNNVFGSFSRNVEEGMVAVVDFRPDSEPDVRVVPVDVNNHRVEFNPRPMSGPRGGETVHRWRAMSRALDRRVEILPDGRLATTGEPQQGRAERADGTDGASR